MFAVSSYLRTNAPRHDDEGRNIMITDIVTPSMQYYDIINNNDNTNADLYITFVVDCGSLNVTNAFINDTSTTYGSIVGVICYTGHLPQDIQLIECSKNGTWSASPACEAVGRFTRKVTPCMNDKNEEIRHISVSGCQFR